MRISSDDILSVLIGIGIGLILLTPFPYATVETWSISFFEIVSFITFGIWLLRDVLRNRIRIVKSPLYIPFTLFFILILFQMVTMPVWVVGLLSPHTETMWQFASEGFKSILGEDLQNNLTLSLNAYATKEKFILYLSYAAFFIVCANYLLRSRQIKRYFWIIFTVLLIESLIGIAQYITSGSASSGTYVNPNHYGGLLLMIIPLSLCYVLYLGHTKFGVSNIWQIVLNNKFSTQLLVFLATCLMGTALIMSQSRGAIFSSVASICLLYTLFSWKQKKRSGLIFIGSFVVVILVYSVWMGVDPVIEKFSQTTEELPSRTSIWHDTLVMIKDFPVFGTGLGTYSLSFTIYKDQTYWPRVIQHAHNDYLQFIAETGIIGFALLIWGMVAFYKRVLRKLVSSNIQADPLRYYLLLGCISGISGLLIHSITDFNLQIPANTYYFVFLLALSTSMYNDLGHRR